MNRKVLAMVLTVALLIGVVGTTAWAANSKENTDTMINDSASESETVLTSDETNALYTDSDETVYVLATATGDTDKIIISGKFASEEEANKVLTDAENVKDGGYWQGTVQKDLPVNMTVSYTLDGKKISPEDLAGKSGEVSIRFDYKNNKYTTVNVDGVDETVCVPFVAITGVLLDSEHFSNISVTNGKLVDDGEHIMIAGVAVPGLQDSLQIAQDTITLPEYIEIKADVQDFELQNTVTLVSNSLFQDLGKNASGEWDVSSLQGEMNSLTDAMTQLISGSGTLYDGLCALYSNSCTLSDGVAALSSGLKALDNNSEALNDGAKQVFTSLLSVADTQLAAAGLSVPALTMDNYGDVLNGVLQQLDHDGVIATAQAKVEEAVRANQSAVEVAVTTAIEQQVTHNVTEIVRANVLEAVLASQQMTVEQYEALPESYKAAVDSAVDTQMSSDAVQQQIAVQVSAYMDGDEGKSLVESQTEQQIQRLIVQNMESDEVQQQIAAADAGAVKVQALKQQLDNYKIFYQGLRSYTAGVSEASNGANQINSNMPSLVEGVAQLRDGAKSLSDGLQELNTEGIEKLAKLVNQDVAGLSQRMQAVKKAGEGYRSFVSENPADGATVKFIYRTDSITTK